MVMTPDSSTPQRQVHDSFLRLEQRHVLSSDLGSKQLQTTLQQEVDKVLLENKTSKVQVLLWGLIMTKIWAVTPDVIRLQMLMPLFSPLSKN